MLNRLLFVSYSFKLNEYLICGHAGGFFNRLTLRRVMEVESGSERFRVPKIYFQENVLVNDDVPASIKYRNKWVRAVLPNGRG